ncbi:MAG: DUF1540 domain-containing protein [Thermobacillus sp.]|jgi:hypothetical protein|uniref:DUF1540 domain-containing protein n=2 Tax=Thermobacillus TaxID=76632 RepID=L0EFK6_THECK|nr:MULTISPECIES: DUF1540 domain-containing protein [Thermobacillus]AGA58461.1 protein of unknown function (DUF1540) [Thermobacillus composti KWC4]REJ19241.1 MAG: DUF1540 domain-containing protein [Paenibacillaceae bacterium]REK60058.1 MAG: DUF1540 domain-containing protein [Thermobacillus sp.]CAG5083590.1 Putative uncharacterized protein [Thermobacillus xylanilyticus]
MPEGVICSVSNCTYWAKGNRCAAEEIMVDIDRYARADYGSEFADFDTQRRETASDSSVTCCHTFRPKEG